MLSFIKNIGQALDFVWQGSHRWTLALVTLLAFQSALPIANLFLLKRIVDKASFLAGKQGAEADLTPLFTDIGLFGGILWLMSIVEIGIQLVSETQEELVSDFMENKVHQKSIALDFSYYENPEYFNNLHLAQSEVRYRPTMVLKNLTSILQSGFSLVFLSSIFMFIHWSIAVLLILLVIPSLFIKAHYSKKLYLWQKTRIESQRKAWHLGTMLTTANFAKEIRLFNIGNLLIDQFKAIRLKLFTEKFYISKQKSIASFLIVLLEVGIIITAYTLIAYRAWQGLVTVGALVMYFQAVQRTQAAIQQLVLSAGMLYQNRLFLNHIFDFLNLKPKTVSVEQERFLNRPITSIHFQNVHFTYPQTQKETIKGISMELKKGQIVAFVGQNGSGKTTLIKLLCRLYDITGGAIKINDMDITAIELKDLRRHISVIFQDFVQYHQFSVADNIHFSDSEKVKNIDTIQIAAQQTGADDFIKNFEKGYEQGLGRDFTEGVELSGGQWQKIALSRAFYKNADVIVLDEPTSAIDPIAEYSIFSQLRDISADKILILITHRLYNLKMADTIFVMQDGQIVEEGNHEFLIEKKGLYWRMFEKQLV